MSASPIHSLVSRFDFSHDTVNVLLDISVITMTVLLGWWMVMHTFYTPYTSQILTRAVTGTTAAVMFVVSLFLTYRVVHRASDYHKGLATCILLHLLTIHIAGFFLGRWMFYPQDENATEEEKADAVKIASTGFYISFAIDFCLFLAISIWTHHIVGGLLSPASPTPPL